MLSLLDYLSDPCGTSSLPYWKQKVIAVPEDMKIIHDRAYAAQAFSAYDDESYFRLFHDLKSIGRHMTPEADIISAPSDIDAFADLINASYQDLHMTAEQLRNYGKTPAYCPELWILMREKASGKLLTGGIADFDSEASELVLEWIQVLPAYRGRGYGQLIVNHLLARMQGAAQFATVSGKVRNPWNPEGLYRKCGFTGHDIWHVLTRR